jgi:hypothetical protein
MFSHLDEIRSDAVERARRRRSVDERQSNSRPVANDPAQRVGKIQAGSYLALAVRHRSLSRETAYRKHR